MGFDIHYPINYQYPLSEPKQYGSSSNRLENVSGYTGTGVIK